MKKAVVLLVLSCLLLTAHAQWTDISSGKIGRGYLCWALDANTCIVPADYGKIYRTTDAGMTFDSVEFPIFIGCWYNDIQFTSPTVGYITGGTAFGNHRNILIKTTDAGVSWDSLTTNAFPGYNFLHLSFANDQVGYISGESEVLLKTTDGGQTLTPITLPITASFYIQDVYAIDANTCFVALTRSSTNSEAYQIYRTTDGGQTWTSVYADSVTNPNFDVSRSIMSITFADANNGFASGANGWLRKTQDGGATWTATQLATDTTFFNHITFASPTQGYISGRYAFAGLARDFLATTDGGNTWVSQPYGFDRISMATTNEGFAVGDGVVYKTTNGGINSRHIAQPSLDFQVVPNPVQTSFRIEVPKEAGRLSLEVYDLSGKLLLFLEEVHHNQVIEVTDLRPGMYWVSLKGEKGATGGRKVVISR